MKDVLIQLLTSLAMPTVLSIATALLAYYIKPAVQAFVQAYVLYRDKLAEEAKKYHAEDVVRAAEQAARANLLEAAERHHVAASLLAARIPGLNAKEIDQLILSSVAALKDEFARADAMSANKVKIPGAPLVELQEPLVEPQA